MKLFVECVLIILVDLLNYTISCGTLAFEEGTVVVGDTAKLKYIPINPESQRTWYKENPTASPTKIYGSDLVINTVKYVEEQQVGGQFTLSIHLAEMTDAGAYIVHCGSTYSNRANLKVISLTPEDRTSSCGKLSVEENNLIEKNSAKLTLTTQLGTVVTWQREVNSSFITLQRSDKYSFTETNDKTVHNLWIYVAVYSDSGLYRALCQEGSVSNEVQLNIVPTAPSMPDFDNIVANIYDCTACLLAELGKRMDVVCSVKGGSQPLELHLFKDGRILDVITSSSTNTGALETIITYSFTPGNDDFDTMFTCKVKNPALDVELEKSAKLYIKVDPNTISVDAAPAFENQTVVISCRTTEGKPPLPATIYFDGNIQKVAGTDQSRTGHTYSVTTSVNRNLTRFDNQKSIMCCSKILEMTCSNSSKVNVYFPPQRVIVNMVDKTSNANGDTRLVLRCSVEDSNPKSSIDWKGVKNVPRSLIAKKYVNHDKTHGWRFITTWVFNLTKDDNYRQISCTVQNSEFPNLILSDPFRPNITYEPELKISGGENQTAFVGESVQVTCHVDSNPPSSLAWYNQTNKITESTYGVNHLDLQLTNVTVDDSQTYTCRASNGIGVVKETHVVLMVTDEIDTARKQESDTSKSSPIAGPIVGCVVAIVLIGVTLAVCLLVRQKKRASPRPKKGSVYIKVEERKPSVYPIGNEPIYNNVPPPSNNVEDIQEEDQPEYASVLPKEQRERDNKQPKEGFENPVVDGDNLVYAELVLDDVNKETEKKPQTVKYEATEYVSIDFSKTGTAAIADEKEF